jgi:hypothetical protein
VPIRWGGKEYIRTPRHVGDGQPIRPPARPHDIPPKGSLQLDIVVRPLDGASRRFA